MVKCNNYQVVFEEIPDKITLAFNITNCQHKCPGCHSPELRKDIGDELTTDLIDEAIGKNYGVNCVCFMGEGNDRERLLELIRYVKNKHNLDTALYTGSDNFDDKEIIDNLNYLKIGRYDEKLGPLNVKTTNQRMYFNDDGKMVDITEKFWKRDFY